MLIVPIMDLKNGQCVHSHYHNDRKEIIELPVLDVISKWSEAGVKRFHLIDIDAVSMKEPVNVSAVRSIKRSFPHLVIEISGGVYNEDDILIWLDADVDFIVLSSNKTSHIVNLEAYCIEYPGKIMLSIDTLDGKLVNQGLIQRYGEELESLLVNLDEEGVSGVILSNKQKINSKIENRLFCYDFLQNKKIALEMSVFLHGSNQISEYKDLYRSTSLEGVSGLLMGREVYRDKSLLKTLMESMD